MALEETGSRPERGCEHAGPDSLAPGFVSLKQANMEKKYIVDGREEV